LASTESAGPSPQGQWIHAELFGPSVPAASRLTLGEGWTSLDPAEGLGAALAVPNLLLKREDLSPTGSHKARYLGYLCSALLAAGTEQAVISSSGNAAIAAAAYASLGGMRLLSLVSPRTPRVKLERLGGYPQLTVLSTRPVALLHHAVREWGMADLRGSVNPLAPNAYRGMAAELLAQAEIAGVFLFSSSGAAALGISQGFAELLGPGAIPPQLHVVEGTPGGELTRPWYSGTSHADDTHLGELASRRSRLAPAVRRAVRESGGRGWRVGARELEETRALGDRQGLSTSWEGIATLAAMRQAFSQAGPRPSGSWVAVLTGDSSQLDLEPWRGKAEPFPLAESEAELDGVLTRSGFTRADGS
jgi:threonine synthase